MPLQTVGKVGRVLELFSVERAEWGVSEVAAALGLPKSGAHALVSSLAGEGILRRTRMGRYRLGWRVTVMNEILLETTDFRPEARRAMEYLTSRFGGELLHLGVLEGGQAILLDEVRGARAIRVSGMGRGSRLSVHGSGVGKALLADRPWADVLRIVDDRGLPASTSNTITTSEGLRNELRTVREQGYGLDLEETVYGLCCAAVPIRDRTGEAVAAINLSAPAYQFYQRKERYLTVLVEVARSVSESIGYGGLGRAGSNAIIRGRRLRTTAALGATV